jgi:rare lipoprotein A
MAACSTSPVVTPTDRNAPEFKVSFTAPSVDKADAAAVLPGVAPAEAGRAPGDDLEPATEPPAKAAADNRPALLAGEFAKEFQRGHASWYGPGFQGRRTASGERFDMQGLTAAHRTLPFGTMVRVHSLVNGRYVDVRITDRGPFSHSRIIDLSHAAAEELGMLGLGFKEVLLLIPESTPAAAESSVLPLLKKRLRPVKPARIRRR